MFAIARLSALTIVIGTLAASLQAQAVTIDSPLSVVQCQPLALNWHGSAPTGEIYISAVQGKDTSSTPLIQFTPQPAASSGEGTLTWPSVNLTAGTQFTLIITDATGAPNFSGEATVLKGTGTCSLVDGSGSSSSGGSTGSTGSTSSSTVSSPPGSGSEASTAKNSGAESTTGSTAATHPAATGSTAQSGSKNSTGSTTVKASSGANHLDSTQTHAFMATLLFAVLVAGVTL